VWLFISRESDSVDFAHAAATVKQIFSPMHIALLHVTSLIILCGSGRYFTNGAYIPQPCRDTNGTVDAACVFAYQQHQITELATLYGPIDYWWFDHHNSDPTHVMSVPQCPMVMTCKLVALTMAR